MNNIFKTIWNKSTQSWVAVSELARGYVKSSSAKKVSLGKNGLSKFSLSAVGIALFSVSFQTISINTSDVYFGLTNSNIFTKNDRNDYAGFAYGGSQKIAIGKNARAGEDGKTANQSIAIGSGNNQREGAWAKGDQSIAIGSNTIAEGDSSIAIGGDDLVNASNKMTKYVNNDGQSKENSIKVAYQDLTGQKLDLTYKNTTSKTLSVAIGVKANAEDLSLALGTSSNAGATNTVAIGSGATATLANSIAIGGGAIANESNKGTKQSNVSIGNTNFTWAGGERVLPGDIVSFGGAGAERQLKNIAPGKVSADSTDAVNGSQLYSIAKILTERSERNIYAHVNTGDNKQGAGNATTNEGQVDEKGGATQTGAATFGLNATASAEHAVAIGTGANATHQNSVALGQGAKTSDVNTNDTMINFKNASYGNVTPNPTGTPTTANGSISFGSKGKERQLQNVAAGRISETSTDAINGSQLYHVVKNLGFNVYQGNTPKSRINNDGIVKFEDGDYTTALVSPDSGNAKVTFNVKTSTIDANTMSVTGNDTNGLAKSSDVVAAIQAAGFTVDTNGTRTGDGKVKHGSKLNINQGDGIAINRDNSTFTVSLNPETKAKIDNIGTGNVAAGDNKTVTGDAVNTAINEAVDTVNLSFEGDNSAKGNVVLKDGILKIKGEQSGPIETTSTLNSNTLTLKIKDTSIDTNHLKDGAVTANKIAPNAVTTNKIADGNVTFEKLDQNVQNKISEKEESVDSTVTAQALGLIVSGKDRTTENKGKLFTIDLNSSTLINKLSENANISSPSKTSPKLVTDVQVKDYISNTPIKLIADNPANPDTNNKVGLGDTLSIKGATGSLITTSVTGSSFTLDLTSDTKTKISNIGTGDVAIGQKGTVTGEKVYQAIDALRLNLASDSNNGNMQLSSTLKIKGANNGPISTDFDDATDTLLINIKPSSITEQYLAPNAVTTEKIDDKAITSAKLGDDVKATINSKEESVNATASANELGLAVTSSDVQNKGKRFTIDLNAETLISKLSENAQIGGTATNKLITDTQLNTYLNNNPLNFLGNVNKNGGISRKLGESLFIVGDDSVIDLTHYTESNIATDTSTGKVIIKFKDTPEFKGVKFKENNSEVTITPTADGLNFTKSGTDTKVKLDNLADADLNPNSKQAVTGSQLHSTNERITSLESGWQIAGNDLQKVQDIKKGTNKVNFVNSKNIEATVTAIGNGASVHFTAKTQDIVIDNKTGVIISPTDDNNLITAKSVADALGKVGWVATSDKVDNGEVIGKSTEKVSSGDTVTFQAGKNLKIKQEGKKFTYSTLDDVNFTKITATDSIKITNGPTLSTTGLDMAEKKITNLADGDITDTSEDAITGKQLKDLADKLGIIPNTTTNNKFDAPVFPNSLKKADQSNENAPKSLLDAINKNIEVINRGLVFGGDVGTPTTQYLGSKFDIKAAAINDTIDNKFVGKNLKTKYVNSNGDGLLSIGLSETPDFKSITLSEGGNPYLTLGKDANENSGKITGLTNRNATNNTDYGTNGNDSRAATEGAVKEISDRIKQSDNTSPFTYVDENGNPITKAADGKFYPKNLVNADGTPKAEANGKGIDPSNVVIKTKNDTPLPITNVRSGLGLDGKAEDNAVEGTFSNPKAIGADKAQKIIAGNNKDGNGGLLTKEGADLNKVATIGDLQALAQAGLDFSGNKGDVIHRPLGTKLEILGKDGVKDLTGYSSENIATETKDNTLYIRFKEKPEFRGISVNNGDDKPQIELTPDDGLVIKENKDDKTPVKVTATGINAGDNKIRDVADADIADDSKDAVTGKQLKSLADKLGLTVKNDGSGFENPTFTAIKDNNGNDKTILPTTLKSAVDHIITTLNDGLTFGGDLGAAKKQYLGSTFDVKAATNNISDSGKTFVGKNLKTSYSNTDGNGILSIGLSDTPDFKALTLSDDNNTQPYLTLGKDGDKNTGKIMGLTDRNPMNNADNYGKNGNEGRAATEGAVKELSDRVNQGDKNSPFVYEKADGTKITKATDGKFYPAEQVNADGTTVDGAAEVPANEVVVKVNDKTPMPITNVRSGLGLDGKSDTDPTTGSQSEPKAISADKAKTAIAGKDGKSGLLSKEGADLNKVSTIGDLQALAQAGLDFAGNKGTVIHRPLGTKLEILGNASIKDDELAKFSTDNIVTETKDDKLYIKFKDIPKLKGLELNSGTPNAKSITISPDDTGSKLTLSGGDNSDVQLDGLQKGQITDTSKNAVTGNQLKDLADKLGVEVNNEKTGFETPVFTSIKGENGKDATDADKPKNLKDAVNKTIEAVNRGLTFTGDTGTGTQHLGSTFNVKSTEAVITKDNKTFVGKNITTKYEKDPNTGDGTLSIGISERPDFEAITLTKDGENIPFLTIGEDTDNTDKPTTGKITGLTARDLGSKGYGVGDNVGRAATEGAVKDLYDKVKSNESSSPFEYKDNEGNKLVKVGDNYYSEGDLKDKHIVDGKIFDKPVVKDGDKYYVTGPDGRKTANEATPITVAEKTPATASNKQLTDISNVRSGLGLDGKSETNSVDGSPVDPKAISTEKAKEVIAGKDGKSGLLTTEGAPLNKVATIGDLQAVAKAGLTFKGNNNGTEVHRPLGTTLDIKGEATDAAGTSGKNVYVEANANDNSLTVKIKETPEFKGLELKDQNTNAIKFTPSETANNTDPTQKDSVLTLSSGARPNNTVKLTGISDGDISPNSKDAVNGSQVFALTAGKPAPKVQDKYITIMNPDGTTTNIDAKNVIVDENGNPLLKTYNVQGQGEHIQNSVITAINNMNNEGIKFFHTNDGRDASKRPQTQSLNQEDSSAGGSYATAVGYRANAAGTNGIAFGSDAVAGKITGEKEATITEVVNGKATTVTRKVRIVEGVNNAIAIGAGALASNDHAVAMGANNQVYSKNSTAIGSDNKIDEASEKTFVLGNNVTVTTARSVFLGDAVGYVAADNKAGTTKGNAEYSEQKIGETTYKYAGGKANEVVGVVSVGNVKQDGEMETRRIQNVAPGLISDKSTDAINGSQLYAVMDSGWNLKAEEVDGTSGKVTKGKADTTKVSIGKTVKVRAGNNVEIAHNKDESIDISTSMAPTFNSLNVNPGGTVNMGGNRVQNVGNAVEAGDAVNYGQFKAEVGKLDSRLQAGIAGAVASGTLVQAFNPNESLVAVGAGTYRGKSAVALGYSRVSDNGKIIIKVTGSTNTYGDVTGGASVGYKF